MPKDNGKVIVSLLAGATAGIVAGLLLAPETGDEARAGLRESARKWVDDLSKLTQDTLSKLQGQAASSTASTNPDQHAADALLNSMDNAEPGDLATPAGNGQSVGGDDNTSRHQVM